MIMSWGSTSSIPCHQNSCLLAGRMLSGPNQGCLRLGCMSGGPVCCGDSGTRRIGLSCWSRSRPHSLKSTRGWLGSSDEHTWGFGIGWAVAAFSGALLNWIGVMVFVIALIAITGESFRLGRVASGAAANSMSLWNLRAMRCCRSVNE